MSPTAPDPGERHEPSPRARGRRRAARGATWALAIAELWVFVPLLFAAIWIADPDDGTSSWSTAANAVQLTLVLAGGAASLAALVGSHAGRIRRAAILLVTAVGLWVAWFVFLTTGIGDSSAV